MQVFKQEYLGYPVNDTVGFLHRHPGMEFKKNLPEGHVIVDEKDWKSARQEGNIESQHSGGVEAKPGSQQLKPKMPLLEEVQQMYIAHIGDGERVTTVELGVVEWAHDYISRHFGH